MWYHRSYYVVSCHRSCWINRETKDPYYYVSANVCETFSSSRTLIYREDSFYLVGRLRSLVQSPSLSVCLSDILDDIASELENRCIFFYYRGYISLNPIRQAIKKLQRVGKWKPVGFQEMFLFGKWTIYWVFMFWTWLEAIMFHEKSGRKVKCVFFFQMCNISHAFKFWEHLKRTYGTNWTEMSRLRWCSTFLMNIGVYACTYPTLMPMFFLFLVTSYLVIKARVDAYVIHSQRSTSGASPANLLSISMGSVNLRWQPNATTTYPQNYSSRDFDSSPHYACSSAWL